MNIEDISRYTVSGEPFTLVSQRTEARFTFQCRPIGTENSRWFVRVLVGPDNTRDYKYLALLIRKEDGTFILKATEKGIYPGSRYFRAMNWLVTCINHGELKQLEFLHSGRCCRCHRILTTPESIRRGIGPKCLAREEAA